MQVETMMRTVEGAHIPLGEQCVSDLMAGCQGARLCHRGA